MKTNNVILLIAALVISVKLLASDNAIPKRPNIILIMADDM